MPKPQQSRSPVNKGSNSNKKWLIAGCCLAGVLLIAAVLLYLLTDMFEKGGYDYDDGNRSERVLRNRDTNDDEPEHHILRQTEEIPDSMPVSSMMKVGTFHGQGTNNRGTFMLEIDCDENGNITGKYTNILYCLDFNVSGVQTSDGTLELKLVQATDGTPTDLTLYTSNGADYTGTWGKNQKPVKITLNNGPISSKSAPNVLQRWHIKGPNGSSILNQDINISEENGKYFFWYPTLGYFARFRMAADPHTSILYNYAGEHVADITEYNDIGVGSTAVLIDHEGQRFDLTRYE